jgi:hypothetical protein
MLCTTETKSPEIEQGPVFVEQNPFTHVLFPPVRSCRGPDPRTFRFSGPFSAYTGSRTPSCAGLVRRPEAQPSELPRFRLIEAVKSLPGLPAPDRPLSVTKRHRQPAGNPQRRQYIDTADPVRDAVPGRTAPSQIEMSNTAKRLT